jgi:hypothetical protein
MEYVVQFIIVEGELMDIALSGRKYTLSNNHKSDPTYELLDRVLVPPDWEGKYPLVTTLALNRVLLDHTPLLIKTGEKPKHSAIFRFENCWFLRPDLKRIILINGIKIIKEGILKMIGKTECVI